MRIRIYCLRSVSVACLLLLSFQFIPAQSVSSDKRIAITIDDLPLNGPEIGLERMRSMTKRLVYSIRKNRVPVVGFVNESRIYSTGEADSRIALLKYWIDGGVELGNHTYSHLGFKGTPIGQYEDDFVRGDTVTKTLMKASGRPERFYRHPFLQMGDSAELEDAFEAFIASRGYKIAPVTIDSLDWLMLAAYRRAADAHDDKMMRHVSDDYLKYVDGKFEYCEEASQSMFGRPISQILLLHANELNADNFDRLIDLIRSRHYQFVSLEEALKDPVYKRPEKYVPTSDWLLNWATNKGFHYSPPQAPKYLVDIYNETSK